MRYRVTLVLSRTPTDLAAAAAAVAAAAAAAAEEENI